MTRTACLTTFLVFWTSVSLAGDFPIGDGKRLVFLGDSITKEGTYVRYIDAYLFTRFPDRRIEVIDLGLSSETVSGTSEADHPFPRPDVHDRLGRALERTKPDFVAACYGMNDGIYSPIDDTRFARYRAGFERLVDRSRASGAQVFVATPPPFDPSPVRSNLKPAGFTNHGYKNPFDGYDGVLARYSDWLVAKRADGWVVADVRGRSMSFLDAVRREEPGFTLARDGVHPDPNGHWLIARAYLDAWDSPGEVDSAVIDSSSKSASKGLVEEIEEEGGAVRFAWTTKIPMPLDPRWDRRLIAIDGINERFNRHRLVVTGLTHARYSIYEGKDQVGEATREALAGGIEMTGFPKVSTNQRSAAVLKLVASLRETVDPSWLEAVEHGPPIAPQAIPLDEAKARGTRIEARIRELTRPVPVHLRLVPDKV